MSHAPEPDESSISWPPSGKTPATPRSGSPPSTGPGSQSGRAVAGSWFSPTEARPAKPIRFQTVPALSSMPERGRTEASGRTDQAGRFTSKFPASRAVCLRRGRRRPRRRRTRRPLACTGAREPSISSNSAWIRRRADELLCSRWLRCRQPTFIGHLTGRAYETGG